MSDYSTTHTCTRREALATGTAALSAVFAATTGYSQIPRAVTSPNTPPNILVFLADSLRADHLGCYGYSLQTSPHIDAMAAKSIIFEQCYSQAPWTKPSIASLFTGYLPYIHQAVLTTWDMKNLARWDESNPFNFKIQTLRPNFTTLAELFRGLGYQTACFQWCPHCQSEFGFGQGFDQYRYVSAEAPEKQVNAVIKWLQSKRKQPFFAFVHAIDPHGPYVPSESFYSSVFGQSPAEAQEHLTPEDLERVQHFKLPSLRALSPAGLHYLKTLYDAEIRGIDYHFGRILNSLAETGQDNNTIIVFIADHGEAFGEHQFFKHNNSLYDEELHVPMILRIGGSKSEIRVPWNVSLYDLHPTLVALAGGSIGENIQAKSLLNQRGELTVHEHRPVYAYFDKNDSDTAKWEFCVIENGSKVYDKGAGKTPEIYDRSRDPEEKENVWGKHPETDALVETLAILREKHRILATSFGEPHYAGIDQASIEELRSLGYY